MTVTRERPAAPATALPPSGRSPRAQRWVRRLPLLPALVFAIVVTQLPFLFTLYYSLLSWNLLRPAPPRFVGLANYALFFTDRGFRTAALNTVVLTASSVILSMLLGIAFAILLDRKFLGRGVVRTLLVTPFLVMPTAAALLWKTTMLNPVFGIVNVVLSPFGVGETDWVSRYPMSSIILVLTWQWTPFMMLIVLAGLQSQATDILEAARVDGGGPFAVFRRLTLPHLRPYIELGILLGSIFLIQTFDAIFMITQGGPGQATTNIPYFLYLRAFRAFDIGQAAALGVVVVIFSILIATVALRVMSTLFRQEGVLR
jgi:sorbitol/mannitol transport system permease protein